MKELKYFHSQDTLHHILGYDKTVQLRLFHIYTKIITRIQKDKNIIKQKNNNNNNEMEKKNNNPKSLNTDFDTVATEKTPKSRNYSAVHWGMTAALFYT